MRICSLASRGRTHVKIHPLCNKIQSCSIKVYKGNLHSEQKITHSVNVAIVRRLRANLELLYTAEVKKM